MTYSVSYKNKLFKKQINKVVADGFVESNLSRYFILEDGSRIEIPIANTIFIFSKERNEILLKAEKEKFNGHL